MLAQAFSVFRKFTPDDRNYSWKHAGPINSQGHKEGLNVYISSHIPHLLILRPHPSDQLGGHSKRGEVSGTEYDQVVQVVPRQDSLPKPKRAGLPWSPR